MSDPGPRTASDSRAAGPRPTACGASRAESLRAALARARSTERPGPDTSAGPAVSRWSGPVVPLPTADPDPDLDLGQVLTRSLAAVDEAGRLRPAPSAGALHPVNAHVLAGPGCRVPPGRYAYDPIAHCLRGRGPAPGDVPAGALVVLTVTVRRTASHYAHRAWPMVLLDTGHAVAALLLAGANRYSIDAAAAPLSAAARLPTPGGPRDEWPDAAVEHPFAAVHFAPPGAAGDPGEALLCAWAAADANADSANADSANDAVPVHAQGASRACESDALVADAARDEGERVLDLLGAGAGGGGTWERPPDLPPPLGPVADSGDTRAAAWTRGGLPRPRTLEAAVARRSAEPPLPGVPEPGELAALLVAATASGQGATRWCLAVGGRRAGLLRLAPDGRELVTLARGDARATLAVWAARQGWLAECGAVLLAYGCPSDAPAARIRREHLAAGIGVGLAQVTATALGLRSRPVGSWQGADIGAALGGPAAQDWIIHGLAVGRGRTP
ncbi:nitroreductase family protein [Streptomyces sp. O3]